mmetsp:Transcript_18943/g.17193  ORF Transcript_18943/g.17193 Transcript_18943/m.17193 type:complete len:528 (+) Transcript_18943:34-1617(+)
MSQNTNKDEILISAIEKISAQGFSFDILPIEVNDPNWGEIRTVCSLDLKELVVLKNERVSKISNGNKDNVKIPLIDNSDEVIKALCTPFNINLSSVVEIKSSLLSPVNVKIPFGRLVLNSSGLLNQDVFVSHNEVEALMLIDYFRSFELRVTGITKDSSEEAVLALITCITGLMWSEFSSKVELSQVFSFQYNKKDSSCSSVGDSRPDETDYLNDFLVSKSEHKDTNSMLKFAIQELVDKLTGYNHVDYGTTIVFLPVIAAAGTLVEFAFIDVRTKYYHRVARFDLLVANERVRCFVLSINFFRLFMTMSPYIPNAPTPQYKEIHRGITFCGNFIKKKVQPFDTCPKNLYELLKHGIPYAVTVTKKTNEFIKSKPVGIRILDGGRGLTLNEVKMVLKSVLTMLSFIHSHGYVHRDIRWPNIIRVYTSRNDGSISGCKFLTIDFELAGEIGDIIGFANYIHVNMVPLGHEYNCCHDVALVGKLLDSWALQELYQLDMQARAFASDCARTDITAAAALNNLWLKEVVII